MMQSRIFYLALGISVISTLSNTALAKQCNSGKECFQKADQAITAERYSEAFDFAKQGCRKNNAEACGAVGLLYQLGRGTDKDLERSVVFLKKACRLNSGDGCAALASAYFSGNMGVEKDLAKAYNMAISGCKTQNANACMLLGAMQINGQGIPKDVKAGQENLAKACQLESALCPRVEQIRTAYRQVGILK